MATGRTERRFTGQRGISIVYDVWTSCTAPRGVVVLSHGFGEHARRYDHVAQRFCRAGFATYALDHRGHGRSGGKRVWLRRMSDYVDDFSQLVDIATQGFPMLPCAVLGHSMGGSVVFAYGAAHPGRYRAMVLSGPAVAADAAVSRTAGFILANLGRAFPGFPTLHLDATAISRDPHVVAEYQRDPLVYHGRMPAGVLSAMLQVGNERSRLAAQLTAPVLVVHGEQDRLASVAGSRMIVDSASSTSAALKVYPELYHEVFNEPERDRVLDDVIGWLTLQLGMKD